VLPKCLETLPIAFVSPAHSNWEQVFCKPGHALISTSVLWQQLQPLRGRPFSDCQEGVHSRGGGGHTGSTSVQPVAPLPSSSMWQRPGMHSEQALLARVLQTCLLQAARGHQQAERFHPHTPGAPPPAAVCLGHKAVQHGAVDACPSHITCCFTGHAACRAQLSGITPVTCRARQTPTKQDRHSRFVFC
jgi:hypothetical protein